MLQLAPFLAAVTFAQAAGQAPDPPVSKQVTAIRAAQSPVIDGRDDDAVWKQATPITAFQEWRPSEGGAPKLPTEAKIAYDAANARPKQAGKVILTVDGVAAGEASFAGDQQGPIVLQEPTRILPATGAAPAPNPGVPPPPPPPLNP